MGTEASSHSEADANLSPWLSAAISTLFWISLAVAASLYATIALSPRLSESLMLQDRYITNAIKAHVLHQEIDHLTLVANALENDPDFVARVASQELSPATNDSVQIHVDEDLNFDARIPSVKQMPAPEPPWYASQIHDLAKKSPLRRRWTFAMLILFGVSFVCFNDGFFSNRIGSGILRASKSFLQRYQSSTADV